MRTPGRDEKPVQSGAQELGCCSTPSPPTIADHAGRAHHAGRRGHFIPDPRFIPPLMQISASERLMTMLRRLIEILEDKSASHHRGAQKRREVLGRILHARDRQFLAAARGELRAGAAAPSVFLQARPSRGAISWKWRGWAARCALSRSIRIRARCRFTITGTWTNASKRWISTSARIWKPSCPPTASRFR